MGVKAREKVAGSGIWWLYVHHKGRRTSRSVGSKEAALKAKKLIEARLTLGQGMPEEEPEPAAPTLKHYYEHTLQKMWEASLSTSTYKSYDGSFRVHILPVLGDLPLDEITRTRVKEFVVSLLSKPAAVKTPQGEDPRLLSKETIRNIVAALRSAFSEAVDSDDVPVTVNPASRVGKLYKEAGALHEEVDPFDDREIPALLRAALEHYGFAAYCVLLTLLHAGLRAGEAAGLQWEDLDFSKRLIHVRRQITRGQQRKPKTRKARKVDMSNALADELQELRKQRKAEYLERGTNEIPPWVFLGPGVLRLDEEGQPIRDEGRPLDMDNFRNRVFLKACDKAGIRRRPLHSTRHSFASALLNNGESLKYVQTALGHSSIRLTADVYGHLEVGKNRQAVDRLPSLKTAKNSKSPSGRLLSSA